MQITPDLYHLGHAFEGEGKANGIPNYTSRALEAAAIIAGASQLYGCTITNTNGSTQYFFFFDGGRVPGSGSAPGGPAGIAIAGGLTLSFLWIPPRQFNAGIVIANSSSATSFTAGVADCWYDVQYR